MVMSTLQRAALADFEFIEAGDGEDALAKFKANSPSIAFCDWNMPNMNGFDFVKLVRADRSLPQIPIIMVTSEKSIGKIDDALNRAGANEYITKPFTVDDVKRKVGPIVTKIASEPAAVPAAAGDGQKDGFFTKLLDS